MTEQGNLSPATQIMIRVAHIYQEHGGDPPARVVAATVLSAAADQVVPVDRGSRRQMNIRSQLLSLATELGMGQSKPNFVHRIALVDYELQELIKALDRCIAADPNAQGLVIPDLRDRLKNSQAESP